jgi:hypothetical protein
MAAVVVLQDIGRRIDATRGSPDVAALFNTYAGSLKMDALLVRRTAC